MELKSDTFNRSYELTNFVNENKIPRENIQQIIPFADGHGWALFWWE